MKEGKGERENVFSLVSCYLWCKIEGKGERENVFSLVSCYLWCKIEGKGEREKEGMFFAGAHDLRPPDLE